MYLPAKLKNQTIKWFYLFLTYKIVHKEPSLNVKLPDIEGPTHS